MSEKKKVPQRSFATRAANVMLSRILPVPMLVRRDYRQRTGKSLDLKNPITFNEKLQWLKAYNRDSTISQYVDKYGVKQIIAKEFGEKYVIPTLKLYRHADEINISELPDKFILKATHGSAWNIICRDKSEANERQIREYFMRRLRANYYYYSSEWVYKNITPGVICEELLLDHEEKIPRDHKIFCFNGQPQFISVDVDKPERPRRAIYDLNWNRLNFSVGIPPYSGETAKPDCLHEMLYIARKFCNLAPFVRVDFLVHEGCPFFGEITFYPGNGKDKFYPESWNVKIGAMLDLKLF